MHNTHRARTIQGNSLQYTKRIYNSVYSSSVRITASVQHTVRMCEEYHSSAVYSGLGALAFLVCLFAIVMVCKKNIRDLLCASVVYRLYVYQVVGAALFSLVCCFQPAAFYYGSKGQCSFMAFLDQFTQCLKLTLLAGVTMYLACSIRRPHCTKNFKTIHEVIYIAASIIIAGIFAFIPTFTNSYGDAGGWCWIQSVKFNCSGFIESTYNSRSGIPEQFVLWYVPAVLLCLAGMIVLGIYACVMICCSEKLNIDITGESQSSNLTQTDEKESTSINKSHLLALILYQMCFFVFLLLPFIHRILSALNSYTNPSKLFQLLAAICAPLWSLSSGAILVGYNVFIWKGCNKTQVD